MRNTPSSSGAPSRATSGMTWEDHQEEVHNVQVPRMEELRQEILEEQEELALADARYDAEAEDFMASSEIGGDDDDGSSVEGFTPQPKTKGYCFHRLCRDFGVVVGINIKNVDRLSMSDRTKMWSSKDYKVYAVWYGDDDLNNHVESVAPDTKSFCVTVKFKHSDLFREKHIMVTTPQQFFGPSSTYEKVSFYSDNGSRLEELPDLDREGQEGEDGFGNLHRQNTQGSSRDRPARDQVLVGSNQPLSPSGFEATTGLSFGAAGKMPEYRAPQFWAAERAEKAAADRRRMQEQRKKEEDKAESVVGEDHIGGAANVTNGVARPKRRAIQAKQGVVLGKFGVKNYRTAGITMFNNVDELFLDKMSRVAAQEVIERLFKEWGVPLGDVDAVSYAEDLLWVFLIARTASNKADYEVVFDVPVAGKASVDADFSLFSRLLESEFGVTRRAFARGVADELKEYLSRDENKFMLPILAQRLGADPQMATLCFDGSTHCSGLTTSQASFTKLLEARNLFERDDVVADGASGKLMQGMSGGVRSVVPR